MSTLRIKNINGTWDKIPILGSAAAVVEAKAQADRAKSEADRAASEADKINSGTYYTKTETDNLLSSKANSIDLNNYLLKSGGTMTGVLNALTAANDDNSTKVATTAFVNGGNIVAKGDDYIRFGSGLQLCWGTAIEVPMTKTTTSGPFGHLGEVQVNFPAVFEANPVVFLSSLSGPQYGDVGSYWQSRWNFSLLMTSSDTNTRHANYLAIGRWK